MQRFFEIIPGAVAWLTLILMVVLSWKLPAGVAVFIILFDIYWLMKTVYLTLHLRSTFLTMRKNMKIDWLQKLMANSKWEDITHLIVLPMSNEPYEVVEDSIASLVQTNYPKEKFIVVLATEERAGQYAQDVASKIELTFKNTFGDLLVTTHPSDIAGELPGKGSNEAWATKQAAQKLAEQRVNPDNVLVSVFDIDTQVHKEYFGILTHTFLETPDRLRAIYQPIPLFTNNIYQAPTFARIVALSCTFWQMMQQAQPERLTTFSSQSIPLRVLLDIGFWHTNVVSEDSRVFWQGYLYYEGNFRVVPLEYPVSMDANVASTFWGTMGNLYKQQRRWGWGVENIPYILEGFRRSTNIPKIKKWYWSWVTFEGFHSWATSSLIIFALGWLPILLGGKEFTDTLLSYSLPQVTQFIVGLSMVGVATSAIVGVLLLPPRPLWFRFRHYVLYLFEWILLPIPLIIFGAIPGLEAQTRLMLGGKFRLGFWITPKGRYPETGKGVGETKVSP